MHLTPHIRITDTQPVSSFYTALLTFLFQMENMGMCCAEEVFLI